MPPLTQMEVRACNHPRLPLRFVLAFICALLLAPLLIVLSLFGVVTLLLFWIIFLAWLGCEILFALFVNNCIMVSELNYPRIKTLSDEMKLLLGVHKEFSVFVFEHGQFNAFMMRMFRRRAIFLNSEILETGVSDDEVRWIIGRFVGYWRSQQDAGIAGWMIRMAQKAGILNFFILPYERAMVYTGDRLGLAGIGGDIGTAVSAMQKLLVGRQLGYSVNPVGVVEQRRQTKGSLFGFLARVFSGFPHTIARYVDLIAFARRQFPEPFGRFDAANPGLSQDLDALSGERTSGGSLTKGILFLVLYALALVLTLALWIALASQANHLFGAAPFGNLSNLSETTAPSETSPPPSDSGAAAPRSPAPSNDAAAPAAPSAPSDPTASPPPQQTDGHLIADPVVTQQPSAADFKRVYPEAAWNAATPGSAVIQCSVAADGYLLNCSVVDETPPGSGFGDAALQLKDLIRLAPEGKGGTPVAGGIVKLRVPFVVPGG